MISLTRYSQTLIYFSLNFFLFQHASAVSLNGTWCNSSKGSVILLHEFDSPATTVQPDVNDYCISFVTSTTSPDKKSGVGYYNSRRNIAKSDTPPTKTHPMFELDTKNQTYSYVSPGLFSFLVDEQGNYQIMMNPVINSGAFHSATLNTNNQIRGNGMRASKALDHYLATVITYTLDYSKDIEPNYKDDWQKMYAKGQKILSLINASSTRILNPQYVKELN